MVPLQRAVLLCGLALLSGPLPAAVLLHEYALRGSLNDSTDTTPLTALGGDITALGYVFAANEGLSFSSRNFTPADFSIELSFKFDSTLGTNKIIDFHNLSSDPGLYSQDGKLSFAPAAGSGLLDISPGMDVHVVLTRDGATNLVTAYVNGQQRFSFVDNAGLASPPGFSNKLFFFVDESNQTQTASGTVNYLRVFNGALTGNEVQAFFAGGAPSMIPEPSTYVLLGLGITAVVAQVRRHKKQSGQRCGPVSRPAVENTPHSAS